MGTEHGLVVPVGTDPTGRTGPTRRAASGPDWRRSSRGRYVPAHVPVTPAQRVVEVGARLSSPDLVVTGWAALCWQGARWIRGEGPGGELRPVDVLGTNHRLRPHPTHRLSQARTDLGDLHVVDGLRVATPVAAVCFAMRHADDLRAAVELLDMTYADDLVDPAEVRDYLDSQPRHRGIEQAWAAWHRGDENAWSPQEVRARLVWEDATGRRPLTNRPLFDLRGRHLGTPDLFDPVAGVGGEYDGDVHLDRARRRDDLARDHRLRTHGVESFTVIAGEVAPGGVLEERRRAAYARAARIPATERRWTLELPHWWVPTSTVVQRRAVPPHLRDLWLPSVQRIRRPPA